MKILTDINRNEYAILFLVQFILSVMLVDVLYTICKTFGEYYPIQTTVIILLIISYAILNLGIGKLRKRLKHYNIQDIFYGKGT
jgi:hypothetical protein